MLLPVQFGAEILSVERSVATHTARLGSVRWSMDELRDSRGSGKHTAVTRRTIRPPQIIQRVLRFGATIFFHIEFRSRHARRVPDSGLQRLQGQIKRFAVCLLSPEHRFLVDDSLDHIVGTRKGMLSIFT